MPTPAPPEDRHSKRSPVTVARLYIRKTDPTLRRNAVVALAAIGSDDQ